MTEEVSGMAHENIPKEETCPDCGYHGFGLKNFHINCPSPNQIRSQKYETIEVKDEELKYRRLTEQQEKHIDRLEKMIESLEEEIVRLRNGELVSPNFIPKELDEFAARGFVRENRNSTLPQGIQLPSVMRNQLEEKLREKALLKAESK